MNLIKEWNLPIVTVSEMNKRGHWIHKYRRFKTHEKIIKTQFRIDPFTIKIPCLVKITRLSIRHAPMDFDNLVSSLKQVRDTIGDCLIPGLATGRADTAGRITFEYNQDKGKKGLRIQFYETN